MQNSMSLVFGAGGLHRIASVSARQRLLREALEVGFRSFDVAPAYGNGLNEVELGAAFSGIRQDIHIATKFGIPVDPYGERYRRLFPLVRAAKKYLTQGYGSEYSRRVISGAAMTESLHKSLRRLRSDYVDLLLIHEPLDPLSAETVGELAEHAERLKREGKIRSFGVCGPGSSVKSIAFEPLIDVVQTPLWDAISELRTSGKRQIAYGVYRCFQRQPACQ